MSLTLLITETILDGNLWSGAKYVFICSRPDHVSQKLSRSLHIVRSELIILFWIILRCIRTLYKDLAGTRSTLPLWSSLTPSLCFSAESLKSTSRMKQKESIVLTVLPIVVFSYLHTVGNPAGSLLFTIYFSIMSCTPAPAFTYRREFPIFLFTTVVCTYIVPFSLDLE